MPAGERTVPADVAGAEPPAGSGAVAPATTATARPAGRSLGVGLASVLTVLAGAASAAQTRVNGGLADRIGSPFVAGLQTVVVGTTMVGLALLARRRLRPQPRPPRREPVRWWYAIGGLSGAAFLSITSAAVPVVGVALVTVALVAGQSAGGLLVDKAGLGPGGHHAATAARVAGATLCVAAVGLAMLGRPVHELSLPLLALSAGAGVLVAGQTAVNGRMRRATGDATLATLVNMAGGLLVLTVVVLALAVTGRLSLHPWPHEWWLYLGGPLGVLYVTTAVNVVRVLGVLRVGLAVVAGSVIGALVLDAVAPTSGARLTAWTVVGAALTLVAVAVPGLDRDPTT